MFTTKPRPVPSKKALKVLYQLAYITAGTFAGVGTLCAEEQRRRVQILQKVADNAKKIRQHPRYRHNAALALTDGGDADLEFLRSGLFPRRRRRRRQDGPEQQDAPDDDFGQMISSARAESDRMESALERQERISQRRRLRSSDAAESHQDNKPIPDGQPSSHDQHATEEIVSGETLEQTDTSSDVSEHDDVFHRTGLGLDRRVSNRLRPFERKQELVIPTVFDSKSTTKQADSSVKIEDIGFLTRPAWKRHRTPHSSLEVDTTNSNLSEVSVEDVRHDVRLFAKKIAIQKRLLPSPFIRSVRIANQLGRLALDKRMLDEIRTLYLWKISQGVFTDQDTERTCGAWNYLVSTENAGEAAEVYANIFAAPRFCRLVSLRVRLEQGLNIVTNALERYADLEPNALLESVLRPLRDSAGQGEIKSIFDSHCKELLSDNQVSLAAKLFVIVAKYLNSPTGLLLLADEIFERAVESGHLSVGAKMLRWKSTIWMPEQIRYQLDTFIQACGDRRAYDLILDLFFRNGHLDVPLDTLSRVTNDASKSVIATACSADPSFFHVCEMMYGRMPRHLRRSVHKNAPATMLEVTWNSTRDLEAVETEHIRLTEWVKRIKGDNLLRRLDRAMVRVYIQANKTELALAAIARAHVEIKKVSSVNISLAALLFANKGLWDSVFRLVEIAESSDNFYFDGESSKMFNKVIRYYSRKHSAADTWRFVVTAMDKIKFIPTRSTTEIMLQCFVIQKAMGLIPRWLGILKTLGLQFELNAKVAAKLLTAWYLKHRPGHVPVMWLCHRLTHGAPSLAGEEFVDLVKEAVGYDLKKIGGKGASWQRELAKQRLQHVIGASESLKSGGAMPRPGYRWDHQLSFERLKTQSTLPEDTTALSMRTEHRIATGAVLPRVQEKHLGTEDRSGRATVDQDSVVQTSSRAIDDTEIRTRAAQAVNPRDFAPDAQPQLGKLLAAVNVAQNPEFSNDDAGDSKPLGSSASTKLQASTETGEGIGFTATVGDPRPAYEDLQLYLDESERLVHAHGIPWKKLERNMVLALRAGQYRVVLDMYHGPGFRQLTSSTSPIILETAVEASLRLHDGDRSDADKIMSSARDAGLNTTCAMGPLLVHQMYRLDVSNQQELKNLRLTVIEYYRMNEENGWPVSHHVGVSAANILIDHHYPKHGLNLLAEVFHSKWIAERPFDIVGMTVFLKGYNAIGSLRGIGWVVKSVLDQNVLIDARFLHTLKLAKRNRPRRLRNAYFDPWFQLCRERKAKQKHEAVAVGRKLMSCLKHCAQLWGAGGVDSRLEPHEELAYARQGEPNVPPSDVRRDLSTGGHVLRRSKALSDGRLASYRYRAGGGELERNTEALLRFASRRRARRKVRSARSTELAQSPDAWPLDETSTALHGLSSSDQHEIVVPNDDGKELPNMADALPAQSPRARSLDERTSTFRPFCSPGEQHKVGVPNDQEENLPDVNFAPLVES